jgi:HEAT repeat protein
MHAMPQVRAAGGVLLALSMLAAGCHSVSPERIQAWKATPEGGEHLVEALRDTRVDLPLRAQAAAALTEMGWPDRVESAVGGASFEDRARLIPAIANQVAPLLEAAPRWDAREVLLALRRHATTDEGLRTVDRFLIPALEGDLRAGRLEGGRHTLKEMLASLGPAALPALGASLSSPGAPFATVVELIDKVADQQTREADGAILVKRARTLVPVPPQMWKALSTLGGAAAVAFLEEGVEKGSGETQQKAAEALANIRLDSALLPFALRMVRNREAPMPVREQMLALAKRIGSEEARKGMIEIIASDPDPEVRFKVFAAVVAAGSGRQVLPALEAFPQNASYSQEEVRKRLVEPISKVGYSARSDVIRALQSRSPVARLVALWTLEKSNFGSDAKQVEKLAKDRGTVKGVPGTTIGGEATRIAAVLKKQAA